MSSNLTFNFNSEYNDIVDDEHYQYPPRKIQERRVRLYLDGMMNERSRQNLLRFNINLTYEF